MIAQLDPRLWTYGCEHEWADWDQRRPLPDRCGLDRRDTTMVNYNGIAVDPTGRFYHLGGEVNTYPTTTPDGQAHLLEHLLGGHCLGAAVNYRSNLHVHIRVPGLSRDLENLKRLAMFNLRHLRRMLPIIEPIPKPHRSDFDSDEEFKGAMRRYFRRLRSHHTTLPGTRVTDQLAASTPKEFFEAEPPRSRNGNLLWYCQPRAAVNLRQMLETDTIEFRHFPGTLDPLALLTCIEWCRTWLMCAFEDWEPEPIFHREFAKRRWPTFPPYIHWMERCYRATVLDGSIPRAEALANIERIKAGEKL